MYLHDELERLRQEMNLIFILVANDEGLVMAEAGEAPGEDFAAYSTSLMETSQKMADTAELGNPVCSALVLKGGRMLLMHDTNIEGQSVYLSILCGGVPAGVQSLIGKIVVCVTKALTGNR